MIKSLTVEDNNILAFSFDGRIEVEDIKRVWDALKNKLETGENLRFYVEAPDFQVTDISMKAIIKDFIYWIKDPGVITKIEKAAFVTDATWLRRLFDVECSLIPTLTGSTFPLNKKERAVEWLRSDEPEIDEVNIKLTEFVEALLLRGLAGIGIGLLAANFLRGNRRNAVGWSLLLGSVALGLPGAIKIFNKNRSVICEK